MRQRRNQTVRNDGHKKRENPQNLYNLTALVHYCLNAIGIAKPSPRAPARGRSE